MVNVDSLRAIHADTAEAMLAIRGLRPQPGYEHGYVVRSWRCFNCLDWSLEFTRRALDLAGRVSPMAETAPVETIDGLPLCVECKAERAAARIFAETCRQQGTQVSPEQIAGSSAPWVALDYAGTIGLELPKKSTRAELKE
jgi:hypothetical protein